MYRRVIVLCPNAATQQQCLSHFKNLSQMKCGQLSLPHKSPWLCFCVQTFHFLQPSSSIVWVFFQCVASLIINSWAAVCQYRSSEEAGGGLVVAVGSCWHTKNISNVRQEARLHKKTKTFLSRLFFFFQPCTDTLSESFHLSWHPEDSLKEPYVSSASSQQQSQDHHALLSYHANEAEIQSAGLGAHLWFVIWQQLSQVWNWSTQFIIWKSEFIWERITYLPTLSINL